VYSFAGVAHFTALPNEVPFLRYDGPLFQKPVPVKVGAVVLRDGRYFADLLPDDSTANKVDSD
jgi:hypothetical protein